VPVSAILRASPSRSTLSNASIRLPSIPETIAFTRMQSAEKGNSDTVIEILSQDRPHHLHLPTQNNDSVLFLVFKYCARSKILDRYLNVKRYSDEHRPY
jgi:hypothetical protein